jgi:hypothetical protein
MGAYGGAPGGGEAQSAAPAFHRARPAAGRRAKIPAITIPAITAPAITAPAIVAAAVTSTAGAATGAIIAVAAIAAARAAAADEEAARRFRGRHRDQGVARADGARSRPAAVAAAAAGRSDARDRAPAFWPRRAGGDRGLWLRVDFDARSPGGGHRLAGDHRRRQSARSAIGERGTTRHDPGGVRAAGFTVQR